MKVQEIVDFIHTRAPFDTQEPYDNAGLLTGDPSWEVKGIHVALDATEGVLDEMVQTGANVLLTHHPLMFSARKRMTECDVEGRLLCRMIRQRVALISVHTNLDRAPGGMNDVLAAVLGLTQVTGEDFVRVGELPQPMTAKELAAHVAKALHTTVRSMGQMPESQLIDRVAVCSGAGSDMWAEAHQMGAQAFVTGEMKHHHALELCASGMVALECGHFATEEPGIFALADALQKHLNDVQYKGYVTKSTQGGYAGRYV